MWRRMGGTPMLAGLGTCSQIAWDCSLCLPRIRCTTPSSPELFINVRFLDLNVNKREQFDRWTVGRAH